MNTLALKLRRYSYTIQQYFMAPVYRALGKQIVHFIHPAKTGGTSVKIALMSFGCKTKTHYFCLHGHNFRLRDMQHGDIGLITVRDETDRDRSVVAARKWKAYNYGPIHRFLIGMGKKELGQLRDGYTTAVHTQEWYWKGAHQTQVHILSTETLSESFEQLKLVMGIPPWVKCGHENKRK